VHRINNSGHQVKGATEPALVYDWHVLSLRFQGISFTISLLIKNTLHLQQNFCNLVRQMALLYGYGTAPRSAQAFIFSNVARSGVGLSALAPPVLCYVCAAAGSFAFQDKSLLARQTLRKALGGATAAIPQPNLRLTQL
jgi:hypothetical protein